MKNKIIEKNDLKLIALLMSATTLLSTGLFLGAKAKEKDEIRKMEDFRTYLIEYEKGNYTIDNLIRDGRATADYEIEKSEITDSIYGDYHIYEYVTYNATETKTKNGETIYSLPFGGTLEGNIGFLNNDYYAENIDGNILIYEVVTYNADTFNQKDGSIIIPKNTIILGEKAYTKVYVSDEKYNELINILEENQSLSLKN